MELVNGMPIQKHDASIHTTAGVSHKRGKRIMICGQGEMKKTEFGALRESNKGMGLVRECIEQLDDMVAESKKIDSEYVERKLENVKFEEENK